MNSYFIRFWLPVLLWAAVIFGLSCISSFPDPVGNFLAFENFDRFAHLIEYAIFSFLLARALKHTPRDNIKHNFRMLAIILAIVYGVTDEIHQSFVPLRTMSLIDLSFDSLGAVLGQMFFRN